MLGPFWAIPTETLPRSVSGSAMGLVNALGNLGGFFGPFAVGFVFHHWGDFRYGFGLLSLGYLAGAGLTMLCRVLVASFANSVPLGCETRLGLRAEKTAT